MKSLDDYAAQCIRCGFCLEACPTYVLTGQETESPRGRIYLARSAQSGKLDWESIRPHMDRCLGCRACETACPSGVEYGAILELAREKLTSLQPRSAPTKLLASMTNVELMERNLAMGKFVPMNTIPKWVAGLSLGSRASVAKPLPPPIIEWPSLGLESLPEVRGQVTLLEGCAMRVLYPHVHEATRRLLRRAGFETVANQASCCGALHAHSGELKQGVTMAEDLVKAMPPGLPIVVNSAGCGSHLKDLVARGELPEAEGRVFDIAEFLAVNGLNTPSAKTHAPSPIRVTYHDACHLAHGQRITSQPRALLAALPGVELVELAESSMCCGSAGTYSFLQPEFAQGLRERKWGHIESTQCDVVVMGNPGCHAWIEADRSKNDRPMVHHLAFFVEAFLSGLFNRQENGRWHLLTRGKNKDNRP